MVWVVEVLRANRSGLLGTQPDSTQYLQTMLLRWLHFVPAKDGAVRSIRSVTAHPSRPKPSGSRAHSPVASKCCPPYCLDAALAFGSSHSEYAARFQRIYLVTTKVGQPSLWRPAVRSSSTSPFSSCQQTQTSLMLASQISPLLALQTSICYTNSCG